MSKTVSIIILIVVVIAIVLGIYYFMKANNTSASNQKPETQTSATPTSATPSSFMIQGMKVDITKQGSGATAKSGDLVTVNYVGTLQDGTKFDSSIDRGEPFQFTLGQNSVIQGWELGVVGMKVGEERQLTIPPELAYGSQGVSGAIPPNATLIFQITLLKIN